MSEPPRGDEGSEEDTFLQKNGYTEDFSIVFEAGENGLDTTKKEILYQNVLYTYDFTPHLRGIAYDLGEYNFRNLPEDLTYKAITQEDAPQGTATYTITIVEEGKTYRLLTDAAALEIKGNSDLAYAVAIVRTLSGLGAKFAAVATLK